MLINDYVLIIITFFALCDKLTTLARVSAVSTARTSKALRYCTEDIVTLWYYCVTVLKANGEITGKLDFSTYVSGALKVLSGIAIARDWRVVYRQAHDLSYRHLVAYKKRIAEVYLPVPSDKLSNKYKILYLKL